MAKAMLIMPIVMATVITGAIMDHSQAINPHSKIAANLTIGSLDVSVREQGVNVTKLRLQCTAPASVTVEQCSLMETTVVQRSGSMKGNSSSPVDKTDMVVSSNDTKSCNAVLSVRPSFGKSEFFCQFRYHLPKICATSGPAAVKQQEPHNDQEGRNPACVSNVSRHGRSERFLLRGQAAGLEAVLLPLPHQHAGRQNVILQPGDQLNLTCWTNFFLPDGNCEWELISSISRPPARGNQTSDEKLPAEEPIVLSSRNSSGDGERVTGFLLNVSVVQNGSLCTLAIDKASANHTGNWTCTPNSQEAGRKIRASKRVQIRVVDKKPYSLAVYTKPSDRVIRHCEHLGSSLQLTTIKKVDNCHYEVEKGVDLTFECDATSVAHVNGTEEDIRGQHHGAPLSWVFRPWCAGATADANAKPFLPALAQVSHGSNATLNIVRATHKKDTGLYCCSSDSGTALAACLMLEVADGSVNNPKACQLNKNIVTTAGNDAEASVILGGLVIVIGLVLIVFFVCNVRNQMGNICQPVGDEGTFGSLDSLAQFRETIEKCQQQANESINLEAQSPPAPAKGKAEGRPADDGHDTLTDNVDYSDPSSTNSGAERRPVGPSVAVNSKGKKVSFQGPRRSLSTVVEVCSDIGSDTDDRGEKTTSSGRKNEFFEISLADEDL